MHGVTSDLGRCELMPRALAMDFKQRGFIGPVQLLTPLECRSLMVYLGGRRPRAAEWQKGGAVTDWFLYRAAANPRLLELLRLVLGDDIILWGCSVVRKHAGSKHPWHVDIETSMPDGCYASAWIGLENTRRNAGLEFIAGSHLLGKPIQQVLAERGCRREEVSTETVLEWAREANPDAELVKPELNDGDAFLFDGHLWHGSRNDRGTGTRAALLLQFASADSPVRMLDQSKLEWPFAFISEPKPPTIVVHGRASTDINRLVAPPLPLYSTRTPMISSQISRIALPLGEHPGGGWQPYQLFGGPTPVVDYMNCHVSVLSGGHSPHPPHTHDEEELLIILDGEAELVISDEALADGARIERVRPGSFAYYPAHQHHTIRNRGTAPVTYVMFKWRVAGAKPASNSLKAGVCRYGRNDEKAVTGWQIEKVMEGATGLLGKLHCHFSRLAPGAGYEPHVDGYDVAIIVLNGRVETLGREAGPCDVIYYAAGQKHGMRNVGSEPAHYLVFEFHSSAIDFRKRIARRIKPLAKQVLKRAALAVGVDLRQVRQRLRARTRRE
jgi:mannose-6-phosphate isomerase-like protein (cupin superfamily)